jgi:hypothetical protein
MSLILAQQQQQQAEANDYYPLYDQFDQPKCAIYNSTLNGPLLFCLRFDSWPQMMTLLNASAATSNLTTMRVLYIKPSSAIVLTSELALFTFFDILNTQSSTSIDYFNVYISGLKGVDVVGDWQMKPNYTTDLTLYVYSSNLAFFMNGQAPGEYDCITTNQQFLLNYGTHFVSRTLFNYFDLIVLDKSVKYDQETPVCPYLFTNAQISKLCIDSLVDSFLIRNVLQFQQVRNYSSFTINSRILKLDLKGYNFKLDDSLMHPLVFEQVQELNIIGSVNAIQIDLLKSFKYLVNIRICVNSLANFFHKVNTEWTRHLNDKMNTTKFIMFSSQCSTNDLATWLDSGVYTYPNQDMCLFAAFPLQTESTVIPVLDSNNLTACTETLAWLTQNYKLYDMRTGYFTINSRLVYSLCWHGAYTPNITALKTKINKCLAVNNPTNEEQNLEKGNY